MFSTYILYSKTLNNFYVGYTSDDVCSRLAKHLAIHKGFTSKAKDWVIVHIEQFASKAEAMKREKQIKRWKSNIRIKELIVRSQLNEASRPTGREGFRFES
jgi:putative endonuclease